MTISFVEFRAIDARYVQRDMQSPIVLQLRAADDPNDHPLLPLRLARMDGVRSDLVQMAQSVIEGDPTLGSDETTNVMLMRIQRAKAMMLRVLECSDRPEVQGKVRDVALAISSSLGYVASALAMSEHLAANSVKHHAEMVRRFADEVEFEARFCAESYEGMQINPIDGLEKVVMHFPEASPSFQRG